MFYVRGLNGHHAVRTWKVAIAAWLLLSFAAAAQDGVHAYDIPAQPLEQAVERFSVISGWSVMYPGDLAAGRSSHALRASLPPLPALQALLQDSGVEAEVIGEQRVVLRRGMPSAAEPGVGAELPEAERRRRYGGLQQRLRAAGRRRLSKQGAPMLRQMLYMAAMGLKRCRRGQPLYDELSKRGHPSTAVFNILARKLARIAWGVFKSGRDFDPAMLKVGQACFQQA